MRSVHKYPVDLDNTPIHIEMPKGAVVLHGDYQELRGGHLQVWAEVPMDSTETTKRTVLFHGTGRILPPGEWRFVNTFLMQRAGLVFHVYELVGV